MNGPIAEATMATWDDRAVESMAMHLREVAGDLGEVKKQLAELSRMAELNRSLQRLVEALASRVVEQSELLTRRAEK